jgi:glutamate/tyrosine decarboxylase-like PLP-dependent enzyme
LGSGARAGELDEYQVLELALELSTEYLRGLENERVAPCESYEHLRARFPTRLPETGVPSDVVLRALDEQLRPGLMASAGPRFFGWVRGGALPVAVAADWLTAAWDQNVALHATAPGAAIVEDIVGDWLIEVFGLPRQTTFALTTGCQMAHVVCLAAARHHLLSTRGWPIEDRGLQGAPAVRFVAGASRHGSIDRAIRLLGFGRDSVRAVPVDDHDRISRDACLAVLSESAGPTVLLLQAGDVNTGACDDFASLIPAARRTGAWVHVDGAFGLWSSASPALRRLIEGVGAADSWATDAHKWLNVPYDAGLAFVAHPDAHRASMSHRAPYLVHDSGGRDPIDWNPEWSRRARAFPIYAALKTLGRAGVATLIDQCCMHATDLVRRIGSLEGAEVLWRPTMNQGLVRFLDGRPGATGVDHDRRTDEVIAAINATGQAFFSGTTWRNRRAMRVSVCCWRTRSEDVTRTVDAISAVLRKFHQASQSPG